MTALLLRPSLLKPSLSLCFTAASPSCLKSTFSPALLSRPSRPWRVSSTAATAQNNSHGHDNNRKAKGNAKGDVDKQKYLLDVMAIRNQGRPGGPAPINSTITSAKEEMQVFEEWASQKLKAEGSIVEPVIQEMRASLIQRLAEASHTEVSNAGPKSLELPAEKDPLAGVSVRPIVVKRRSKVPENWDGPGGTVVLIDKPQGDVALTVTWRKSAIWC